MKKLWKYLLLTVFLTLLYSFLPLDKAQPLLFEPLQVQAKEKWAPTPLPAMSIDTTLSDTRFVNPEFILHSVKITYQGHEWIMGMDALKDVPVRLTNVNGKIGCEFLDTSVLHAFFAAIDAELKPLTARSHVPVYDNGAGSYIIQEGQVYNRINHNLTDSLAFVISSMVTNNNWADISQELTVDYLVVDMENGNLLCSSDFVVAGSCTTSFRTSDANRSSNIQIGSSRLNQLVLMPGQELSVSEALLPRTAQNGYKPAGVYLNGVHTTGMGGGVCQISSTVYNAIMNAGLTVIERHPHSMPVSYLPKGLDAAIAAGSKDLILRNDYQTPVILLTDTANKKLTVQVLVPAKELAGRSFKLWSKQTDVLAAKTYLTIYQDGRESSTIYIDSSKYKPYKEAE